MVMVTRAHCWHWLVAMVAVGCVSVPSYYMQPELPPEQRAIIKSASIKQSYQRVWISAIDGKELEAVKGNIELAPGLHYLKLFVSSSGLIILFGEVELRFNSQARHLYEIGGTIEHGTARVWITDTETKQVIARGSQKIATTGGH